ncbi:MULTISPECIES: glycoside hydrolase family 36 protein [Blautia]|uniref:glycoside hydrolase family 36 protein n=1 Tax=Blautia TaxID=572511 RepID=UPI000BA3B420|nr:MULTISPECIES: glycoside hydrolase family 36 protein [Blautia]
MENLIQIKENGINLVFKIAEDKTVSFLHCQKSEFNPGDIRENQEDWYRLVEVQLAGEDQDDHHGSKYTGTLPGRRLVFCDWKDTRNGRGRKLELSQRDERTGLFVTSHFQFTDGTSVLESWTTIVNQGVEPQGLTYVSSFALTGITKASMEDWDRAAALKVPSNTWYGEFQWKDYTLPELGLYKVFHYSTKRLSFSATGTWNSHEFLPMGYISCEDSGEGWYFSILHNGSWHWEVSDIKDALYLQLSGPAEAENHWFKWLEPEEAFESVHAAVAVTTRGFEDAVAEMTGYRRLCRRRNEDNEKLPVIFNDFMNCLGGDPTEEKEYPLIDAAAEIGCEYYTIDAGWYANGSWWSRVGEWEPSSKRFPHGLSKVLDYIRDKGMVPGLWLELEVMGIHCPIAAEKPDDWFFCRHGRRVIDHGRYQLDYRNLQVRQFAHEVVRRLVEEYGAGYIKMDYNINAGIGTELGADSAGDGLLLHNRAYLSWLDEVFLAYPKLIIENCGSGGMRINDALLSRHSIQSSSDQTEYTNYAAISAAAPAALTPEQNAVWSYPLTGADAEQTAFNMVNAMTMRIHQSGHLAKLSGENKELIREGIAYYKSYRELIKISFPFWPLGMPAFDHKQFALGFRNEVCAHLAVWNIESADGGMEIPLDGLEREISHIELVYPASLPCEYRYYRETGKLVVRQPEKSARLFKIDWK